MGSVLPYLKLFALVYKGFMNLLTPYISLLEGMTKGGWDGASKGAKYAALYEFYSYDIHKVHIVGG